MPEFQIQKYKDILRRSVDALEGKDPVEREAGYEKLRQAVNVLVTKSQTSMGPEVGLMLRDTLEEMIQPRPAGPGEQGDRKLAPGPEVIADSRTSRSGRYPFLGGVIVGLIAAAALGAGLAAAGALSGPEKVPPGVAAAYQANLPLIPVAEGFLERIRQEVVSRQAKDPEGLRKVAGEKFVALNTLAPELAKQLPARLGRGSSVIVRADATGYKILLNWTLCATVQFAKPKLVDPVRKYSVFGCSHFGVWNQQGAKW